MLSRRVEVYGLRAPPATHTRSAASTLTGAAHSPCCAFWLRLSHTTSRNARSCSGCTLQTRLDAPPLLAEARAFFAERGVADFQLATGAVHGWRNRARLAVRGASGAPVIGLFAAASHDVVAVPRCAVHHPSVNAAVALLTRAATAARTAPYDEASRTTPPGGALRYVQVATHGTAPDAPVELSLVWAAPPPLPGAPPPPELAALVAAITEIAPRGFIASLWANYHAAQGNAIVSPHWARLDGGSAWHWERFGGADVAFAPGAFLQANYAAFDALCTALAQQLPPGCALVDFYAGTGPLGLAALAAGRAARLTAVELTQAAAAPFAASAARLAEAFPGSPPAVMRVASAGAGDALALLREGDALIVDPPRKGLDSALLAALCAAPQGRGPARRVTTLAYVSCGFAALKKDADALIAAGWTLQAARAFTFFPGTDALETLATFTRAAVADAPDADAPLSGDEAAAPAVARRRRRRR